MILYDRSVLRKSILTEGENVHESGNHKLIITKSVTDFSPEKCKLVAEFIKYCGKELHISQPIEVTLVGNRKANHVETLAYFNPLNNMTVVYVKSRLLADILRSLAHELKHLDQNLRGVITPDSGKTGSPHENEANSFAGVVMRDWAKLHPEIFD